MKNTNTLGTRVTDARKKLQPSLTQNALAERLTASGVEIDGAGISAIERGLRRVSQLELLALAEVLNKTVYWLLTGQER